MLSNQEWKQIWKNNTPPPQTQPFGHDASVTIRIGNVKLSGEVRWNKPLEQYVFRLTESMSDVTYALSEIPVQSDTYLTLRKIVRDELFVFVTRGFYDAQCPPRPPRSYIDQLPLSFAPTILKA